MYHIIILLCIISPFNTLATDTMIYNSGITLFPGLKSEVFIDEHDTASIYFINKSATFSQHSDKIYQHHHPAAAYWIRFQLKNNTNDALILLKDLAQTTAMYLYKQLDSNTFSCSEIGNNIPFHQRKYPYTSYLFDLNIEKGETSTFYAKIKGDELMNVHLQINNIKTIYDYISQKELLFGIFSGLILLVFFYNLFFYFSTRQNSFLLYVCYTVCIYITLASTHDYSLKYLWSENTFMAGYDTIIFGAFSIFFIYRFVLSFLNSKINQPKTYKILNIASYLSLSLLVSLVLDDAILGYQMINIFNLSTGLLVLFHLCIVFKRGYKPVRFLALGWFLMLSFSSIFALTNFGIFENNFFTFNTIYIGTALEAIFVSFALADKINYYKTLSTIAENDKKEILKKQNNELEQLVKERTKALQANNLKINLQNNEKEILLKEVHHRVKNNLQIITSLLNLQKNSILNDEIKDIFTVSQNRINSMAIIHEMLYQNDQLSGIDFYEYLPKLTKKIIEAYKKPNQQININFESENYIFDLDHSITLGLLMNEIISNSIKHGFKHKNLGNIDIQLKQLKNGQYNMMVCDDGLGFDSDREKDSSKLGLLLIKKLSKQLNGQLNMQADSNGVHYNLIFGLSSPNSILKRKKTVRNMSTTSIV